MPYRIYIGRSYDLSRNYVMMMQMNREQLLEHFRDGFDGQPDELVLELGITVDELLERFEDKVDQYLEENYEQPEEDTEGDDE